MIILVIIELFITIITLLSQSVDIFPALRSQDKLYISITILILALLSTLTIFILTRRKMKNHYYLGGTFVACSILVIFICRLFIQVPVTDLEIRYKPLLENEIETPGLRVISDDGERFESSISSGDRLFPFITGHSIGEIFDFKSDNINKPSIILDYNKAKTWRMFYIMLFQIYLLIGIVIYWFSKTENRVSYDPLLNIFNRQHSLKILNEQSKLNTSAPFAIAMVDIDFFKKVNDTYGHKAGDDVLVNVAQVLEQICGTDGVVCRYGGEEIVIFFPKKTRSEASKIIEVARKNIEQLQTKSGKKNISVTISTGISNRENNKQELNKVLQFADKALYSAKNSGRNKTKMVKTPVPKQEKQTQLISKKKNIKSKISKNGAAKNNKSKKS